MDELDSFFGPAAGSMGIAPQFASAPQPFLSSNTTDIDPSKFRLGEFDIESMSAEASVIAIGMRGSGKSTLGKNILYHNRDKFAYGIVQSGTEQVNHFWETMVPALYVYNEFNEKACYELFATQDAMINEVGRDNTPNAFLIFDDLMYSREFTDSKVLRLALLNGRHSKIFVFITSQYALGILPMLRSNITYTFLLREVNVENRKKLYYNYAGVIPSLPVFEYLLRTCTEERKALVLDNTCQSWDPQNAVFYFTPRSDLPPFTLCSEEVRAFAMEADSGSGKQAILDPKARALMNMFAPDSNFFDVQMVPLQRHHRQEEAEEETERDVVPQRSLRDQIRQVSEMIRHKRHHRRKHRDHRKEKRAPEPSPRSKRKESSFTVELPSDSDDDAY